MKAFFVIAIILLTTSVALAETDLVALPAPKTDGKISVEKALQHRRSLRTPAPAPLSLAEVGQLCWAAQGVTDDKGHRTTPSAMATYPLELYVIVGAVQGLTPGVYQYKPSEHALILGVKGDQRQGFMEKAVGQKWIATAPAIFVIAGSTDKMGKLKDRKKQFMYTEAGLAAQGFFLQAESLGLGSTFVGGFDPNKARKFLSICTCEDVLAVLPVGKKT
jgi:SagB-type dehydrogenase family enzyme